MHVGACILWACGARGNKFFEGWAADGARFAVRKRATGQLPIANCYSLLAARNSLFEFICSAMTSRRRSIASMIFIEVNE